MRCCLGLLLLMLSGCSSLQPRPAVSTLGCVRAARDEVLGRQGTLDNDKRLHCLVSAQITRQCSRSEAYLAGVGKELADLFGQGDAEWADWQADRAGIHCGRHHDEVAAINACCLAAGD